MAIPVTTKVESRLTTTVEFPLQSKDHLRMLHWLHLSQEQQEKVRSSLHQHELTAEYMLKY